MQPTPDDNPLSVMQQGETIVCEIKRHPIGLLSGYLMAAVIIIVLIAGLVIARAPLGNNFGVASLIVGLVTLLVVIFAYVTTKVYNNNRWIVTSDSVTQVVQYGLFNRQSSQLSMANLEDITVEQNGILPHMFNYGMLRVQTAGEHAKFSFPYCPNPNHYAQQILNARELFELAENHHVSGVDVTTKS